MTTEGFNKVEINPDPDKGQGRGRLERLNGQGGADDPSDPTTWRSRLDLRRASALEGREIKPREWVVDQWVPRGHLTGLYGPGSVGKTTLALQLCCAASLAGGHWLGMPVRKSRAFGFFCEDDDDEIERKIYNTAKLYGHKHANYRDFAYLGRFGCNNLLFVRSRAGMGTTPLYADLCQMVGDEQLDLLVFDGIPDIYALSINDQGEVTWALSMMLAMAKPTRASVILLGHPNKAGTSEFTGSAAWENKPRARLYLGPIRQEADAEPEANDPRRLLSRSKANLAAKDSLAITWADGAFRVADPKLMTMDERCAVEARQAAACKAFLAGLESLTRQRRHTSHAERASNYAPRLIGDAGFAAGFTRKELVGAMHRLFEEGRILAQQELWRGADRHVVTGIAAVGCGKVANA